MATGPPDPAEQLVRELSHELASPFCPGQTLARCGSKQARAVEDRMLASAEAGQSREQIEQTLVATYGPEILGNPSPAPLLVGTLLAAALAALVIGVRVRAWRAVPREPTTARAPTPAERDALLDALDDIVGF